MSEMVTPNTLEQQPNICANLNPDFLGENNPQLGLNAGPAYKMLPPTPTVRNDSFITMTDNIEKLAFDLAKAQSMMTGAIKDANNTFYNSKYADLHSVIEATREPLTRNNLCIVQVTNMFNDKLFLITMLLHTSGQWVQSKMPIIFDNKSIQGLGGAITYYRRYCWSAICGLSQVDDDAESATLHGLQMATSSDLIPDAKIKIPVNVVREVHKQVLDFLASGDELGLKQLWAEFDADEQTVLWGKFNSQQRSAMKELMK